MSAVVRESAESSLLVVKASLGMLVRLPCQNKIGTTGHNWTHKDSRNSVYRNFAWLMAGTH
jgi:hypothetical protein